MEGGQSHSAARPYLGWSVFTTICCCLPLGIAAIICSCRALDANQVGESALAEEASRKAKVLNIIGLVCGIIMLIVISVLLSLYHKHVPK
uniref:Uncharacterized protein n=1 Tax=Sphaeramia orbicularis TaxID=375764 RepID=A0A672YE67_9TELE